MHDNPTTQQPAAALPTAGKEQPSQCSTRGSEADVLKGAIKEVTYFTDLEAVQIVLTLADGSTSSISVEVTQHANQSKCGAPATGTQS